jgi:hypothetical protein
MKYFCFLTLNVLGGFVIHFLCFKIFAFRAKARKNIKP